MRVAHNIALAPAALSVADVARHAQRSGPSISDSTVWRWLHEDAIRPWQHCCWIFPRDPHFQINAGRILDLYERRWQGQARRSDEFVISTAEKTNIQGRLRVPPGLPTEPGKSMRVEHEYARGGALVYLAALDVHRTKVVGRCEATTGIAPFERLVEQVMSQAPYNTARRVFWDNGSTHRGQASVRRLMQAHPTWVPVHEPVHASWLNQIEIHFSIMQRNGADPERLCSSRSSRRAAGELRASLRRHRVHSSGSSPAQISMRWVLAYVIDGRRANL